ncbi:DUF6052 family protein [Actinophytocola gossypii]|uniref:Uncharacterized protein n=1 Tax=Actinophytocola gossypii TaxID=2812003 RepID=A0ABT2JG02_9PSEU|nr:DUF6052 family protein [Actinophytocola gossypii]MCT2586800.1 hypothetical protein [Actinophytocola gossypii]
MTNARVELTELQVRQLRDCYRTLRGLAESVGAPGVRAAVRIAVADLHAALEGQALEFDLYTHRWDEESSAHDHTLAS